MASYRYKSITEVSELVRQQKVSPEELVSECLEHIEQLQPGLNAFITVAGDAALQDAARAGREIQAGKWKGPLHGIPVGVKDFFDTAGVRTTGATAALKDRVPTKDAEVVTRLKEAGAIVLGKLNMHELGMGTTSAISYFGAVHNPWNTEYVAGGSSGGSAAAVAAGLCYATIDTDAVGSCRLPAACCGVVGLKATYGLLSTQGILGDQEVDEFIVLLGHTAVTCRSVEDAALLLNALARPEMSQSAFRMDYRQAFSPSQKGTLGVAKNFKATDEVRAIFSQAVETFQRLGYAICEVDAPLEFSSLDLKNIEANRAALSDSLFREIDVLLLPTITEAIPTIEEARARGAQAVSPDNTFFCNYYALPAISVPCGFSANDLPSGLQLVGPRWGEGVVLEVAHAFQRATSWHEKHPALA